MKKIIRIASFFVTAFLIVMSAVTPANSASISGPWASDETSFGLTAVQDPPRVSVLEGGTNKIMANGLTETVSNILCTGVGANPCNTRGVYTLHGNMLAPKCDASEINCIEGIYGFLDGVKVQGEFIGYTADIFVEADKAHGLYNEGQSASRWKIPGVLNAAGTDTYLVSVAYGVNFENGKYRINHFTARIVPYIERSDPNAKPSSAKNSTNRAGQKWISFTASCGLWGQPGVCGERADFAENQRVGLSLRFQNEVSNWFQGRLNSPDIKIKAFAKNAKKIEISGEAIRVPEFQVNFKESEITPKISSFMKKNRFEFVPGGGTGTSPDHEGAFEMLDAFRTLVKDQAARADTHWYIANLFASNTGCLASTKEVLGIVTTNSMVYQPEPPQLKNGYLQYSVSGLHYETDGVTPQLGTYDLIMRTSVARCLFNIPKVPISGSVSVVNEKGIKSLATTVVSDDGTWVKLRAAGFTFSNKTIKVKITKKKK